MSYGECIRALKSGRVVAFGTDTFYALACDPFNLQAVNLLKTLKGRSHAKPLPLLIAQDYDWHQLGCEHTELTRALARSFWPGKLTLIVPCQSDLAALMGQKGDRSLGLRAPGGEWLMGLLSQWEGPLVGTSANLAGQPPACSCGRGERLFWRPGLLYRRRTRAGRKTQYGCTSSGRGTQGGTGGCSEPGDAQ